MFYYHDTYHYRDTIIIRNYVYKNVLDINIRLQGKSHNN